MLLPVRYYTPLHVSISHAPANLFLSATAIRAACNDAFPRLLIQARAHLHGIFALACRRVVHTFVEAACIVAACLGIDAAVAVERRNWILKANVNECKE